MVWGIPNWGFKVTIRSFVTFLSVNEQICWWFLVTQWGLTSKYKFPVPSNATQLKFCNFPCISLDNWLVNIMFIITETLICNVMKCYGKASTSHGDAIRKIALSPWTTWRGSERIRMGLEDIKMSSSSVWDCSELSGDYRCDSRL